MSRVAASERQQGSSSRKGPPGEAAAYHPLIKMAVEFSLWHDSVERVLQAPTKPWSLRFQCLEERAATSALAADRLPTIQQVMMHRQAA